MDRDPSWDTAPGTRMPEWLRWQENILSKAVLAIMRDRSMTPAERGQQAADLIRETVFSWRIFH